MAGKIVVINDTVKTCEFDTWADLASWLAKLIDDDSNWINSPERKAYLYVSGALNYFKEEGIEYHFEKCLPVPEK